MDSTRGAKRVGAFGTMAVLVIWLLNPLGYLVRETLPKLKISFSGVTLSEGIEAPGIEIKICHHHPEGCPKGCFCPKTTVAEGHPGDLSLQGTLSEPALAKCTDDVSKGDFWVVNLLCMVSPWEYLLYEGISRFRPPAASPLSDRYPEPSQKIPIA